MRAWPIVVVVGVTLGLVGPRIFGESSRPAVEPFEYAAPEGFVERPASSPEGDASRARAWELPSEAAAARPVVVVHHSALAMQVDEPSLAKMAGDMPNAFEDCTWVHRRHETRVRADGARVGLIEGDCDRELDLGVAGLPKSIARSRKLQLVFPENEGTSIATVAYPTDQAARWEPVFEATVDGSKGVAKRVPSPPVFHHVAWGAAGLVLGGLAAALVRRREPEPKS